MNVSLSEIQKQIRVCEAVQQTYEEAADGVDRLPIQKVDGDPTRSIERRELRKDTRDFRNVTIRPKTRVNMLNIQAAPDADIDVFSGDPLDYHYFRASFRDAVESRIRDQQGLLTRLIKYTAGEPKELIKGFVYSDSSQFFDEAIELLEKEYGNTNRVSSAYLKELRQWPVIKYGDAKAYNSFFHFFKKCEVLKMQGQLASLDSVETIRSVVCKFPPQVQESWNRKVLGIKETKLRESDFSDLVDFADYQSQLVNNPEYSRDAFSEIKDRSSANPRVRNFLIGGTEQKKASGWYLCSSNHLLDSCGTFAEMTLEGRLSFIKERRLCFGCLLPTNPNHYYRVCERKMTCTICNGKHPTSLYEGNIQRHSSTHASERDLWRSSQFICCARRSLA